MEIPSAKAFQRSWKGSRRYQPLRSSKKKKVVRIVRLGEKKSKKWSWLRLWARLRDTYRTKKQKVIKNKSPDEFEKRVALEICKSLTESRQLGLI
ncbi:hypothetical protein GIB67_036711 [Kingdonia uniflora]|uniref:Uncharacterized protein n=1 Tax=Kingdonia uniflora TaxID=39325 RepID=A0A7J7LWQ8_9MAGN|nr:hypothetical protein GIB67_036711 [Kingdonia uniflora]